MVRFILVVVGTLLCAGVQPARALQPCRRPTPASLIYPYQTENVPRDVVIYARAFSRTRLRLVGPEGRPVLVAHRGAETSGPHISGLVRLVPTRLLAPMTGYQVQYSREQRDYSKPGMPFVWGPYQPLGRFRTGTTVIGRRAPSPFLSGALEWSKLIPRSFFRRGRAKVWTSGGGRQGTLRLRPGTTAPVVIELQIWITEPGQRDAAAHNLAFLFRPALTIAQAGPCSGAAMLSNVRNGRYRATITPWSPNGVSGPQLRLEGRIR